MAPDSALHIADGGPVRVVLFENIHSSAKEAFEADGCQVELLKGALDEASLKAKLQGVHVVGIRSKTQLTPEVLASAKDLLSVGCFCIGTNQVALDVAHDRGVPVFNAPFSNTRSVAELVMAEVVMLTRQLGDRVKEMHAGTWTKKAAGSHEIRGKTLGIVGYGHIGSQVGILAESFGMRAIYFDIATKLPLGNNQPRETLKALLEESDFVTLHVPATPQTHEMIGPEELAAMKPTACLINASRGTVVQIPALAAALREGRLAGAAIDVFPKEPASNAEKFESELQGLPNVVMTPHIGGSTEEAQASIGKEVSTSLLKFLRSGATAGAVNFPEVELPPLPGTHRILNVHRNVPGVLRDINRIVSELDANIHAQVLATDPTLGYLVMDLDQAVSEAVGRSIAALKTDVRTRIIS